MKFGGSEEFPKVLPKDVSPGKGKTGHVNENTQEKLVQLFKNAS